jgi:GNAT superfamily N-acetyltransferase
MPSSLNWKKDDFVLSTDKDLLQSKRIHHFLSTQAYWCLDIPLEVVEKSIAASLCFGLYHKSGGTDIQIGFARVVTDNATFAWLCDVYIEDDFRKNGLSKWMVECVLSHPDLQNLRRFCLGTRDAHTLYERFGFQVTKSPQNFLEIKDNDLYRKMKSNA